MKIKLTEYIYLIWQRIKNAPLDSIIELKLRPVYNFIEKKDIKAAKKLLQNILKNNPKYHGHNEIIRVRAIITKLSIRRKSAAVETSMSDTARKLRQECITLGCGDCDLYHDECKLTFRDHLTEWQLPGDNDA